MKTKKISTPKKLSITKIQDLLWEECKRLTRDIYSLKTSENDPDAWECYTCGKSINSKKDAHTGHFIPRSTCGAFLKYDLRNLRVQCMACNVWGGGMGAIYYRNMVTREGQEFVDELFRDKQKIVKATDHYILLLEKYKKM